jgi:hypothetical protein
MEVMLMGFKPENGDKIYNRRKSQTLGADAEVWIRLDPVDPGYVLEIEQLVAYGNNSAAGESVDVGYSDLGGDFYIEGVLNTGAVDYRVRLPGKLFLGEGAQPMVHFEAGNTNEKLVLLCNGILKKLAC